ncbi:MAG TPA: transposase [Candidatus Fermentibacter daniensis]|nr:transposase [Candidatus Fermentibacter daniensis]
MRYQSRLDRPGSTHHVMCRAVDGCAPFIDMESAAMMLASIEKSNAKYRHTILAWALMPNHLHLLVRCGEESLSGFIRSMLVRFAMIYNREHKRRGHLFQGRFRSILVEDGRYVLQLIRYIHLNPVRAGIVHSLNQLDRYPLTGHRGFITGMPEPWHDVTELRRVLSDPGAEPMENYLKLLKEGQDAETDAMEMTAGNWLLGKAGLVAPRSDSLSARRYNFWGAVLGSREFAVDIARTMAGSGAGISRARENLDEMVAQEFGTDGAYLMLARSDSKSSAAAVARRRLAAFLHEKAGLSASQIARYLRKAPSAVSRMLKS